MNVQELITEKSKRRRGSSDLDRARGEEPDAFQPEKDAHENSTGHGSDNLLRRK